MHYHLRRDADHEIHLVDAVANYCDPKTWQTLEKVKDLNRQGIRVAIRIHTKCASEVRPKDYRRFKALVASHLIHEIGEIGLDHSVAARRWYPQVQLLEHILTGLDTGYDLNAVGRETHRLRNIFEKVE
jgi:Tat protein secretion system quality control protein TatD with DNase activity